MSKWQRNREQEGHKEGQQAVAKGQPMLRAQEARERERAMKRERDRCLYLVIITAVIFDPIGCLLIEDAFSQKKEKKRKKRKERERSLVLEHTSNGNAREREITDLLEHTSNRNARERERDR